MAQELDRPVAVPKGVLARRNLIAASLQRVASLLSAFIRIPILLHTLGPARYGVWLGVFAVATFTSTTDFGLQLALTQQVAELRGRGRLSEIRPVVATAFWLSATFSAVVSVALIAWVALASPFQNQAFKAGVPGGDVRLLLLLVCLASVWFQPLRIFAAARFGFEQSAALNVCDALSIVVNLIGLWMLTVAAGDSLLRLGAWTSLWDVAAALVIAIVLLWRHKTFMSAAIADVRRALVAPLMRRAGAFFFAVIGNGLRWSLDGLIILSILGPTLVPRYEPSMRLFMAGLTIVPLVFGTLWPSFAESAARRDWQWLDRATSLATVSVLGFAVIVFSVIQVLGQDFLLRWVGAPGFSSRSILLMLGVWFLLTVWVQIIAQLTISLGAEATVMKLGLGEGFANVLLTIVFAHLWGLPGVALASLCAVATVGAIPVTVRFLAVSQGQIALPTQQVVRLGAVAVAAAVTAQLTGGRGSPLPVGAVVILGSTVALVTGLSVWWLVFTKADRRLLTAHLRRTQTPA